MERVSSLRDFPTSQLLHRLMSQISQNVFIPLRLVFHLKQYRNVLCFIHERFHCKLACRIVVVVLLLMNLLTLREIKDFYLGVWFRTYHLNETPDGETNYGI